MPSQGDTMASPKTQGAKPFMQVIALRPRRSSLENCKKVIVEFSGVEDTDVTIDILESHENTELVSYTTFDRSASSLTFRREREYFVRRWYRGFVARHWTSDSDVDGTPLGHHSFALVRPTA